jgi:hypothetical protein
MYKGSSCDRHPLSLLCPIMLRFSQSSRRHSMPYWQQCDTRHASKLEYRVGIGATLCILKKTQCLSLPYYNQPLKAKQPSSTMATKRKSKAQLKRMTQRAAARGVVYPPPENSIVECNENESKPPATLSSTTTALESDVPATDKNEKCKLEAVMKLKTDLEAIEKDKELKAKDRRSAKRKAEAIASEQAGGISTGDLLEWYTKYEQEHAAVKDETTNKKQKLQPTQHQQQQRHNPYIAFIGQLAFTTTKESLFQHIQTELGKEHKVTLETTKIRLLTKDKMSRGMAFVEVDDPEYLYALLRLHHSMLDNRRINVERSAGGGSETKQLKIQQYRKEQQDYLQSTTKQMLDEYVKRGEIREGELDERALMIGSRHTTTIVGAALERYVESNGREMDNPSSYFTFLLGKLATEGVFVTDPAERAKKSRRDEPFKGKRSPKPMPSSEFAKGGVDMSISKPRPGDVASIFPSFNRGRGRGRGY